MANNQQSEQQKFLDKIDHIFPENGKANLPDPNSPDVVKVTMEYRRVALALLAHVPHTRERSLAFTALEESYTKALQGLARL